ncbi:MAG TPA: alkaline phosphatase family protein [Polyangia bacterium]
MTLLERPDLAPPPRHPWLNALRRPLPATLLALGAVLAAIVLAICQGSAYWNGLDRGDSPLDGFAGTVEPRPPRLARRVVFVILDGLRVDRSRTLPTLNRLRAQGASRELMTSFPTTSIPQYYAALSGIEPRLSGARTNRFAAFHWHLDSVIGRAAAAGLSVATMGPHRQWFPPGFARLFRFSGFGNDRYEANLRQALATGADLTVLVDDRVDHAGHNHGGASPEYAVAAVRSDEQLASVLAGLDLTRDAILVTADHGHTDRGGHGGAEPEVMQVPFVAAGAGIRPGRYAGAEMIDVGPTLAALLGVPAPTATHGRPLTDLLDMQPEAKATLERAAAARHLAVETYLAGRVQAEAAHEAARRRVRLGVLAVVLAGVVLALRRARVGAHALAGGLAYVATFVGVCALAGGRLSLSWARTEGAVIVPLVIATLAGGVVYLVLAGRTRLARERGTAVPELLAAAALAALPWAVVTAIQGAAPGLLIASPSWTAAGLWGGTPLICFAPWALLDVAIVLARRRWGAARPAVAAPGYDEVAEQVPAVAQAAGE